MRALSLSLQNVGDIQIASVQPMDRYSRQGVGGRTEYRRWTDRHAVFMMMDPLSGCLIELNLTGHVNIQSCK